jgi:hypothetical protein
MHGLAVRQGNDPQGAPAQLPNANCGKAPDAHIMSLIWRES